MYVYVYVQASDMLCERKMRSLSFWALWARSSILFFTLRLGSLWDFTYDLLLLIIVLGSTDLCCTDTITVAGTVLLNSDTSERVGCGT